MLEDDSFRRFLEEEEANTKYLQIFEANAKIDSKALFENKYALSTVLKQQDNLHKNIEMLKTKFQEKLKEFKTKRNLEEFEDTRASKRE